MNAGSVKSLDREHPRLKLHGTQECALKKAMADWFQPVLDAVKIGGICGTLRSGWSRGSCGTSVSKHGALLHWALGISFKIAQPFFPPDQMARPRVFISSTFYDLRQVRSDLERFIREVGYEPVQHERGQVPYGSQDKLESYCYKEIAQVDIVVNIVGGRFGSGSFEEAYSVSQMELKTALRLNKQSYIFVDGSVMAEYRMYLKNKGLKGIQYVASDDEKIFRFIEEMQDLPRNNQIIEFRQAEEIAVHLREQWAGLFQRFLQEQEQLPDRRAADELHEALKTVNQLVTFLTNERREQGSAINEILLTSHPIFARLREVTNAPYPIFFRTFDEMNSLLKARKWRIVDSEQWDSPGSAEWVRKGSSDSQSDLLKISLEIFEDGKLRVYTMDEWNEAWVEASVYCHPFNFDPADEEVPF